MATFPLGENRELHVVRYDENLVQLFTVEAGQVDQEIEIPWVLAPRVAAEMSPILVNTLRDIHTMCDPTQAATVEDLVSAGMDLAISIQFLLELLARISCDAHHAFAQLASPAEGVG